MAFNVPRDTINPLKPWFVTRSMLLRLPVIANSCRYRLPPRLCGCRSVAPQCAQTRSDDHHSAANVNHFCRIRHHDGVFVTTGARPPGRVRVQARYPACTGARIHGSGRTGILRRAGRGTRTGRRRRGTRLPDRSPVRVDYVSQRVPAVHGRADGGPDGAANPRRRADGLERLRRVLPDRHARRIRLRVRRVALAAAPASRDPARPRPGRAGRRTALHDLVGIGQAAGW